MEIGCRKVYLDVCPKNSIVKGNKELTNIEYKYDFLHNKKSPCDLTLHKKEQDFHI